MLKFRLLCISIFFFSELAAQNLTYPWHSTTQNSYTERVGDIKTPKNFDRVSVEKDSFQNWLRHLPLKPKNTPVLLYNGNEKYNQSAHIRVIDIDTGNKNLQQCADAVIRLRAEYLFSIRRFDKIQFNFTSGDAASYTKWINGFRPIVNQNAVKWHKIAVTDSSYSNFCDYLETLFMFAGSYSLRKEMKKVKDLQDIMIGDVFIQGGFPGHAVIVVDLVESNDLRQRAVLLAQSYMPAQDMHILVNPENDEVSPWYIVGQKRDLKTPEWEFKWDDLFRLN